MGGHSGTRGLRGSDQKRHLGYRARRREGHGRDSIDHRQRNRDATPRVAAIPRVPNRAAVLPPIKRCSRPSRRIGLETGGRAGGVAAQRLHPGEHPQTAPGEERGDRSADERADRRGAQASTSIGSASSPKQDMYTYVHTITNFDEPPAISRLRCDYVHGIRMAR